MRLTSLLAVAALPWAAARTANVRGSQEEHQSVHRAVKENDKKNPKDWRESASISSSPTLSFEDYTMDGCGNDPCGQCAGDCDRDTDCEGDLICFQRTGDENIVGCSGDASSGWDYCYDPSGKVTVLAPTPAPAPRFEDYTMDGCGKDPCGQCEGDCDRDTDCEGDLICFQREGDENVAGCRGAASSGWDYCYDPRGSVSAPAPPLTSRPAPPPTTLFVDATTYGCGDTLCGLCQGDCDNDGECQGDLVCFLRTGDEPVAGCSGESSPGWDYCYDPSSSDSAPAFGPPQWPGYTPNGLAGDAAPPGAQINSHAGYFPPAGTPLSYPYGPPPAPVPALPSQQGWYASPAGVPTPVPPPPPSPCKEQTFRGELSPNFYHMAMLGQNDEVHQFFTEAAFPKGIDIDIDIRVMGIDPYDKVVDEELNFNFLGVDTDRDGPTPYEVPPSEDDVYFVEVIQSMPRCSEYRLEVRNLKYPFSFLEVYRVGGAASYYITFSYPNGCDFASRFVYVHDGWVRDETGETPEVCLNF